MRRGKASGCMSAARKLRLLHAPGRTAVRMVAAAGDSGTFSRNRVRENGILNLMAVRRSDKHPSQTSAAPDLGAAIAELAIHLAHLYFERAKMFQGAADRAAAARDRSRAESLHQWAIEASEATNVAGRDVLQPELEQLKKELDSFELSKGVGAP